jgi:hypothetical protein
VALNGFTDALQPLRGHPDVFGFANRDRPCGERQAGENDDDHWKPSSE